MNLSIIVCTDSLHLKSGEGNGNPLQYSCLENPMDRGTWQATVHGVTRVRHDLATKPPPPLVKNRWSSFSSVTQLYLTLCDPMAACQASLCITNSRSLLKLMSIELVMPSNHLILCCPLLFLSSIFPSIRVFSNESVLRIRWPKY